jgi:hypothetical protein
MTRLYDASDHALIGCGPWVDEADSELGARVTPQLVRAAVGAVPEEWLQVEPGLPTIESVRDAYVSWILGRLEARDAWLPGLRDAAAAAAGARS